MDNYWETVNKIQEKIRNLEHFDKIKCLNCEEEVIYHILQFYAVCPNCDLEVKVRIPGMEKDCEVLEIIDTVLEWMGNGEELNAVLRRQRDIQKDIELDKEIENEEN